MGTSSHRQSRQALDALVDGELRPAIAVSILEHAERCTVCRDGISLTLALKRSLQRLAAGSPPRLATIRLRRFAEGLLRDGR